jgi:hypothetical protein
MPSISSRRHKGPILTVSPTKPALQKTDCLTKGSSGESGGCGTSMICPRSASTAVLHSEDIHWQRRICLEDKNDVNDEMTMMCVAVSSSREW